MQHEVIKGSLKFAVVGAGPAGFYAAEALVVGCPGCEIDIIERLPTPYGLIRYGVAPDHQHTKSIQETFDRIIRQSNIRYVGNVVIGRDIQIDQLTDIYDAVVLTCGVSLNAPLDVRGAYLKGVYGAAEFVGWYNAHPDYSDLSPDLASSAAVIIGNGNVALDLARVLSKPAVQLAKTDIATHALQALTQSKVKDVYIVGRRGPLDAKFTNAELQELGKISGVNAVARPDQVPTVFKGDFTPRDRRIKLKNLECFQAFTRASPNLANRAIRFEFNARPVEVVGRASVEGVRFERTRIVEGQVVGIGEFFEISCGLVVSAIGYRTSSIGGYPIAASGDHLLNERGRIAAGLYVAGWLRRGPSGKIGTNRLDAEEIAERIKSEGRPGGKPGFLALRQILEEKSLRWISFDDWKRIERAEAAAGVGGSPRLKFADVAGMLAACAEKDARDQFLHKGSHAVCTTEPLQSSSSHDKGWFDTDVIHR